jgi:hypothetical protein
LRGNVRLIALLLSCLEIVVPISAQSHRAITSSEAQNLVLASLTHEQKCLPGLGLDPYSDPNSSRFLFFTVVWASGPKDSVVVGNFAVDPKTGDVWSATSSCLEERNRKLRALQRHLRAELGLTNVEYRRLKTSGPLCLQ